MKARNRYGYGLGTIGRDASYTLIAMFLLFYLTDVLEVSAWVIGAVTVVMVVARIFDAINDPFMGVIVDNTRSRWGKFKPWIAVGAVLSTALMVVLFTDFGLDDGLFVAVFAVAYIGWGITFTMNDIAYWSMLPALTRDQTMREKIGAFARICANIGAFGLVVAIVPVSHALADATGSMKQAYFLIAVAVAILMLVFQGIMLALVKEDRHLAHVSEPTRFRELLTLIFRNDQLLPATGALLLYTTASTITTTIGLYYFKYIYGDEEMYTVFALILGVSQIATLIAYPAIAKRVNRKTLFTVTVVVGSLGYALFGLAPAGALVLVVVGGLMIFSAQAATQVLMLMFITDSVEYGQWKFGKRNDSVTLSLQPFINKMAGALATGVVGWVVIASGVHEARGPADVTAGGAALFKAVMFVLPIVLIIGSYLVYRQWYTLDEERYSLIVADLEARDAALTTEGADA